MAQADGRLAATLPPSPPLQALCHHSAASSKPAPTTAATAATRPRLVPAPMHKPAAICKVAVAPALGELD